MIHMVKDDSRRRARRDGRNTISARIAIAAILAVAVTAPSVIVRADGIGVTIRSVETATERITVPLNGSVIVETVQPVARVQAVESSIAKVEAIDAKQYLVTGVGYGTTQIVLWTESGEREVVDLQVELDLRLLNERITEIDPQSDAVATSVHGNIVLMGTVSGPKTAEQLERFAALFVPAGTADPFSLVQNNLMVAGQQQVMLRCTVAEVNRGAMRRLGFNGFMAGKQFGDAFVVNQVGGINPANIGAAADVNITGSIPFLTGEDGIPLSSTVPLSVGFPKLQMQMFIDALAENSLLRVLAEPDLVTVSGETASFLAGGEFPIPVPQSGASTGAITIEFREFGVRVNFTPVVLDHQRIRMRVAPEVSETDFSTAIQIQGFVVPGLTQRRVETTVEIGDGQTIAVAGLLSEEVRGIANKVPALGDVPVLGALFRSIEYRRAETELVVLVTPEIIAPLNPDQVPDLPGENYLAPNDYELYALGLLEGEVDDEESVEQPGGVYQTRFQPQVAPLKSQPDELSLHGPWGYSTADDM